MGSAGTRKTRIFPEGTPEPGREHGVTGPKCGFHWETVARTEWVHAVVRGRDTGMTPPRGDSRRNWRDPWEGSALRLQSPGAAPAGEGLRGRGAHPRAGAGCVGLGLHQVTAERREQRDTCHFGPRRCRHVWPPAAPEGGWKDRLPAGAQQPWWHRHQQPSPSAGRGRQSASVGVNPSPRKNCFPPPAAPLGPTRAAGPGKEVGSGPGAQEPAGTTPLPAGHLENLHQVGLRVRTGPQVGLPHIWTETRVRLSPREPGEPVASPAERRKAACVVWFPSASPSLVQGASSS